MPGIPIDDGHLMLKRTVLALALLACTHAAPAPPASSARTWIERSNQNAQLLLDVQARFIPELSARLGVAGIDDKISDFAPRHRERLRQATKDALAELERRQAGESDPLVAQDLAILIDAAKRRNDEKLGSSLSPRRVDSTSLL